MGQKINHFDRETLRAIRKEFETAFAHTKDFGVKVELGSISFNPTQFTAKITGSIIGKGGLDVAEKNEWELSVPFLEGLQARHFGATFIHKGETFKIVGYKPRASRFPIKCLNLGNKQQYKFPIDLVKRCLGVK